MIREWLDIYWTQSKTLMAQQLQYRAALLIWLIGTVLEPVMYLTVWSTVARAQGGSVGGFTPGDFAAYYIVLMMVNHLTFTWHMWEYDYRIRQGELSPLLLRPLHPIHIDIAENITYKLFTLLVMVPAALALAWAFRPVYHPIPWAVAACLPAVALAFAIRFLLGWVVAISAFWTTRISAVNQVYFVLMLFFAGQLAPLSLLPGWIQTLAAVLPFRWMVAFPVELFLGRLAPREMAVGLLVQAVWLAFSLLLVRLVWRVGVRRYSAVGA